MWRLKTSDGWYLHEIRGAGYLTWVQEQHKERAVIIPANKLAELQPLLSQWSGIELEAEQAPSTS